METINKKMYIIPAIVLLVIILIIVLLSIQKKQVGTTPSSSLLPTRIITPPKTPISPTKVSPSPMSSGLSSVTPSVIPAQEFTGVSENQSLPKDVELLGVQKTELRRKTPLSGAFGSISFDYEIDTFIVTLGEPKETNKALFEEWLKKNYPAIPLDRFIRQ